MLLFCSALSQTIVVFQIGCNSKIRKIPEQWISSLYEVRLVNYELILFNESLKNMLVIGLNHS